jgi:hypothetical protein
MQRHYFADFEGYRDGRAVLWGQVTVSVEVDARRALDPDALIAALRRRAAETHGIEPGQVRLCQVARL